MLLLLVGILYFVLLGCRCNSPNICMPYAISSTQLFPKFVYQIDRICAQNVYISR